MSDAGDTPPHSDIPSYLIQPLIRVKKQKNVYSSIYIPKLSTKESLKVRKTARKELDLKQSEVIKRTTSVEIARVTDRNRRERMLYERKKQRSRQNWIRKQNLGFKGSPYAVDQVADVERITEEARVRRPYGDDSLRPPSDLKGRKQKEKMRTQILVDLLAATSAEADAELIALREEKKMLLEAQRQAKAEIAWDTVMSAAPPQSRSESRSPSPPHRLADGTLMYPNYYSMKASRPRSAPNVTRDVRVSNAPRQGIDPIWPVDVRMTKTPLLPFEFHHKGKKGRQGPGKQSTSPSHPHHHHPHPYATDARPATIMGLTRTTPSTHARESPSGHPRHPSSLQARSNTPPRARSYMMQPRAQTSLGIPSSSPPPSSALQGRGSRAPGGRQGVSVGPKRARSAMDHHHHHHHHHHHATRSAKLSPMSGGSMHIDDDLELFLMTESKGGVNPGKGSGGSFGSRGGTAQKG
eukprot:Rmarinus@m.18629